MNNEIINRLERIETKLDRVIKAMHDYDGDSEYGESSFEAFMDSEQVPLEILQAEQLKQWEDERGENDDSNTQDERGMVVEKKRNNGRESGIKAMNEGQPKQKQYYKNKRSKRNENKK